MAYLFIRHHFEKSACPFFSSYKDPFSRFDEGVAMEDLTIAGMLISHKLVDTAAIKVLGAMRYLNTKSEAVKDRSS